MKFGICGYGNLGKAAEEKILSRSGDEIVGIFSRRPSVKSNFGTHIFPFEDAAKFEGKIDVMLMCGGSQEDLGWQSPQMLQYFDIVDTFDTHAKIAEHKAKLSEISKQFGHKAIFSCGWDPGLFSLIRTLASNIFGQDAQTFWGKGVSQGHSEALRNIAGVQDAIQFTVPRIEELSKVMADPTYRPPENEKHDRVCYVCPDGTVSTDEIAKQIENTPNYFKGQHTQIHFCSQEKVSSLKDKMFHQGVVIGGDGASRMEFSVKMESNPSFTAQIMLAYARALPKLETGAYSAIDVPLSALGDQQNDRFL